MAFRGNSVKEPLCANSLCWHIDWTQFNWSQQTARQGVTWELRKPVSSLCLQKSSGPEDPSSNGKFNCQGLMVSNQTASPCARMSRRQRPRSGPTAVPPSGGLAAPIGSPASVVGRPPPWTDVL